MNYLITGATGLIGQKLISQLLSPTSLAKQDLPVENITVLSRDKPKAEKLFAALLAKVKNNVNLHVIETLTHDVVNNQNVVINLAGEPIANKRWHKKQKEKICQSRWQITQQLVNLISQVEKPPTVFISGSAVGIYGRQLQGKITEAFTEFNQEFTYHVCNEWESIARKASSDRTRVALLRTGIVLDPSGGALAKMLLPFRLGLGGKIGNGKQMMSWIHIDDMTSAILHIIKTTHLSGAINITAPYPVNNAEFSHTLAKTLERPCVITTPAWLLKVIFGEMADLLLYGQAVYPKKLLNTEFDFRYPNLSEALLALKLKLK